jgi:hypothetical protein
MTQPILVTGGTGPLGWAVEWVTGELLCGAGAGTQSRRDELDGQVLGLYEVRQQPTGRPSGTLAAGR